MIDALSRLEWRRWRLALVGGAILAVIVVLALAAALVAPHSPNDLDVGRMLQGPSPGFWLGTDEVGRDLFTRTLYAARISLRVAFLAAAIGLAAGTLIGLVAGYLGGWADLILMRLIDLLFAFPPILLAIALMASLGTSIANATLAIGIVFVPAFARVARSATELAMREPYVVAARAVGMSHSRIMLREILPNIIAPLLATAAVAASAAMLIESALSFLGLATQVPDPSWGSMLNVGRGYLAAAPWLTVAPGGALFLAVLGFGLLAEGLRDLADPRLRS